MGICRDVKIQTWMPAFAGMTLLLLSGCAQGFLSGIGELEKNNLGYVVCVKGSGPPLTGRGDVVVVGLKQGFQGIIMVKDGCEIAVDQYLPYRDKVEELKKKEPKKDAGI